jgi:hypothetical protein
MNQWQEQIPPQSSARAIANPKKCDNEGHRGPVEQVIQAVQEPQIEQNAQAEQNGQANHDCRLVAGTLEVMITLFMFSLI